MGKPAIEARRYKKKVLPRPDSKHPSRKGDRFFLVPTLRRKKLTREKIAKAAGCKHPNVTQFISGSHSSIRVAQAIHNLTGLPLETVLRKEAA